MMERKDADELKVRINRVNAFTHRYSVESIVGVCETRLAVVSAESGQIQILPKVELFLVESMCRRAPLPHTSAPSSSVSALRPPPLVPRPSPSASGQPSYMTGVP